VKALEKICGTLAQFVELVYHYPNLIWAYRGQADIAWPLRPKAGRSEYFLPDKENSSLVDRDLLRFNVWRSDAIAFHEKIPSDDLECLAFAQHYGLATRLLDWSTNPLVALYFAVEDKPGVDGAVYCYAAGMHLTPGVPFSVASSSGLVLRYNPRPIDRRVLAQSGIFTYHPKPQTNIEPSAPHPDLAGVVKDGVDLVRIKIPSEAKQLLRKQLDRFGMSRKTLFPDLEGLSSYLNWDTSCIGR
jgi:hypothetical protein